MRWMLLILALAGCRRPAAPEPDAGETIEMIPPGEVKQRVEETLEKEHEKTLEPKVE